MSPLLLDTHVWIWYLGNEEDQMPEPVFALIDRHLPQSAVFVSNISVWEIGLLAAMQRLRSVMNAEQWIGRAERAPGISFLPLDRDALFLSTQLPGDIHGDPVDRILIATAQLQRLTLVTADARIIEYARLHPELSVCDARS